MNTKLFKLNSIAASLGLSLGTVGLTLPAHAAEEQASESDVAEVIQVRGIRGSLIRAMDIKRSSSGVIDAISAEEMGKFPDTNLAESLGRITGVSISRSNGEGSQITVRGFGPDFNLIMLNGRQMPGTGYNRSYDLENLSPDGVSALELQKTARAETSTGGLGATVNIRTTKPLASPGLKYTVSAKAIHDTSVDTGSSITPQLSALYSNTFADNTIGVAVSLSHQERNFQQQSASISGWQIDQGLGDATGADAIDNRPDTVNENGETVKAGHTYLPRGMGYEINNFERTRSNGQITFQYAPTEDFTATLDYTASEAVTAEESMSFGVWFNYGGNIKSYELDENGTAIKFNEANNDYAHTARKGTTEVKARSIGLNLEWQATDDLHLELDYHDSSNETDNGADPGSQSSPFIIIAPNNLVSKTYDYSSGDFPQLELFWPDGELEAQPEDFDVTFAEYLREIGKSEIQQLQLNSEWVNPDYGILSNIRGGVAYTKQTLSGENYSSGQQGPVGYAGNQAIFPDSMFTRVALTDFLDEFASGGNNMTTNYYYDYDFDEAMTRTAAFFDDFSTDPMSGTATFDDLEEATTSAFLQTALVFDLFDKPADLNFGVRYEKTTVTSIVNQDRPEAIQWVSPTEWNLSFSDDTDSYSVDSDYDVILPMMDFKIELTDDFVARFSAGKSIARAPLDDLKATQSLSSRPKPGSRTGSSGNPGLLPYEATNIDLSFEYYYGDASYVSLGIFQKTVNDWIASLSTETEIDGLRDPLEGPRAEQAIADIRAANGNPTYSPEIEEIYQQIVDNGGADADGVITQSDDDPLAVWRVTQPLNYSDKKQTRGIEFALQHMFGDTGFGTGINVTLVDSDNTYDNDAVFETQTPLAGLSDSANFQGFYEKEGLSVKVTYSWRDGYLIGVGQDQGSSDNPPQYHEDFGQLDFSVNYDVTDNLAVSFEGVNLTNETERGYGRYEEQFLFARQYGARYIVGARYSF